MQLSIKSRISSGIYAFSNKKIVLNKRIFKDFIQRKCLGTSQGMIISHPNGRAASGQIRGFNVLALTLSDVDGKI